MLIPTNAEAAAMRALIIAHGHRRVASGLGITRHAVQRLAAALPMNESVLIVARERLKRASDVFPDTKQAA